MNEQEKALQGMIEFCQWLIPNAKQLGLEQSKGVAMISHAKTPDDIVNGMNSLYQELGEEQFIALTQAFQKSKSENITMNKQGGKINYLVNKFQEGGSINQPKVKTYEKWSWTPWWSSFKLAPKTELPQRHNTFNPRIIKRVYDPVSGLRVDRIIKQPTGEYTERRIHRYGTPEADTIYRYNENRYIKGDEMYDRYEQAWREYGVYKKGGNLKNKKCKK